jgi:hypothetical protein
MKLISYSMNKWWKLSFVACVFWAAVMLLVALDESDLEYVLYSLPPITIWLTARWLGIEE